MELLAHAVPEVGRKPSDRSCLWSPEHSPVAQLSAVGALHTHSRLRTGAHERLDSRDQLANTSNLCHHTLSSQVHTNLRRFTALAYLTRKNGSSIVAIKTFLENSGRVRSMSERERHSKRRSRHDDVPDPEDRYDPRQGAKRPRKDEDSADLGQFAPATLRTCVTSLLGPLPFHGLQGILTGVPEKSKISVIGTSSKPLFASTSCPHKAGVLLPAGMSHK